MKKKNLLKSIAITLCGSLLLSGCVPKITASSNYPAENVADETRRTIPYAEMEYVRPDGDAIKAELTELTESIKNAENFDALIEFDNKSSEIISTFSTMSTLAMLKNYHDAEDTYFEEEYRYCQDLSVELGNSINNLNRAIVEGPYANQYKDYYGEYVFQDIQNSLLLNSVEVEPLKQKRNQINIDYNNTLSTLSITGSNGQEYTINDIYAMEITTQADVDLYLELLTSFYKGNADQFTEYYIEMIKLDKEIAQKLGFETAADMYYLSYSRDYTPEDAMQYAQSAKEIFVPMAQKVNQVRIDGVAMDLDETLETMPSSLAKVDPYFKEVWQELMTYGVYDFAPLPSKQSGIGFTTQLSDYDTPFIYTYWDGTFNDATTIMHEFGHFTDSWYHYDDTIVSNLDIAETYSQGLELLMNKNFTDFTSNASAVQKAHIQQFTNPLTYQALLEEFQQKLYAMDTDSLTTESISTLYTEMMREYGYGDYLLLDENGIDYSWFSITHLFDAPFYTISYWTSACVALQIWDISRDDYAGAVAIYTNLMQADQNQPYTELIASVGLKDPGDPETLKSIATNIEDFVTSGSSSILPFAA